MAATSEVLQQMALTGRALYRSILRLHRERLPGQMRELGDSYTRAEFRSHLRSKSITVQQAQEFLTQWKGYLAMLSGPQSSPAGGTGGPSGGGGTHTPTAAATDSQGLAAAVDSVQQVSEGLHVYMSPEQRLRMDALKKAAGQLGSAIVQQHQQPPRRDQHE